MNPSSELNRAIGRNRRGEMPRDPRNTGERSLNDPIIMEAVRTEIPVAQFLNQTWPQINPQGNWGQQDPQTARFFGQQELADVSAQFREYMGAGGNISRILPPNQSQGRDPRYMLQDNVLDQDPGNMRISAEKQESILKWFDRSVEKELKKRRDAVNMPNTILDPALASLKQRHGLNLNVSKGTLERMAEASASRLEVASQMRQEQINELTNAVDNLAKAEAMCAFAGAVRAAEAASENVSPEMVEEAAAAGAREYQTDVTEMIQEAVPGEKPVEVIGYVGITRPKFPIKPKK